MRKLLYQKGWRVFNFHLSLQVEKLLKDPNDENEPKDPDGNIGDNSALMKE